MGTARHSVRASRAQGSASRQAILDAASRAFATSDLSGVSVSQIASAADVFPSQVTYYFGTKEALFVEAACREVLRIASSVEAAGLEALDPESYVRAIVGAALADSGLLTFAEAMLLARRRDDLAPLIARTFNRLHSEGARAVSGTLRRHGWGLRTSPETEARAFWATVIGVALERSARGDDFDPATAEAAVLLVLNLHGDSTTKDAT